MMRCHAVLGSTLLCNGTFEVIHKSNRSGRSTAYKEAKIITDRTRSEGECFMAFVYQKQGQDLTKRKSLGEASKLFNSMGEKEYESSLKVQMTVNLRRTPRASKENTIVPDIDISKRLTRIPSKSIGASKIDEDGQQKYQNAAICGFIVPVNTLIQAKDQSDIIQEWFEDSVKEAIPNIELGGKSISWDKYSDFRQKVTNFNQNVARQVVGQLDARNVQGQIRQKLRAELMAKSRMVLSNYAVDINIMITHNIYDSYFVKNFEDDKEIVDYYSSRTKLYSRNLTKRISIPVSSMEELDRVFQILKGLKFDFNKLQVLAKKKVVELSQHPAKEEFIQSDENLASELGFNDNTEVLDNESFESLDDLFSLFHHDIDGPINENENAIKPDSLS